TITSFLKKLESPANSKNHSGGGGGVNNSKKEEPRKRKARIYISSDEDEAEVPESPQVSKAKKVKTDAKASPAASAATTSSPKGKKLKLNKLSTRISPRKVNPMDLFGGETKRVEAKKPPKPKEKAILELEDDEIDQSLMEIDLEESILETSKEDEKHKQKTKKKEKISSPKEVEKPTLSVEETREKSKKHSPKERADKVEVVKKEKKPANEKHHDLDTSVLTDEERHERKRMSAILYQKYKNRSAVLNPGSKEVPKGKPNCLAGLTFLVTGVLESLERDECCSIIKEYGGKTMTVVGKRLNYLIAGEDSGPKKLAQAEEFGVKVISEDGFFDLIREKSGLKKNNGSHSDQAETSSSSAKEKKEDKQKSKEDKKSPIKKEKLSQSPPEKKPKLEELDNNLKKTKAKADIQDEKPVIKQEKEKKEKTESRANEIAEDNKSRTSSVRDDMMAWVDKYKPESVKDIIGQQGPASNVAKLTNWLSKWYVNHDGKKKLQKPNPWAKNDDGSYYKAALLSGPPGIGKTTTATLVCKELGFDAVEFNASDTRSKRLLKEEVSELLSNKSLYGYFHGNSQAVTKKHVLIMDEVDGMAGNEDRGGIQELIALIKESSVPIVCMCNDRNHQKMRSLVNYCYDLRFNRPQLKQIKGRILSICAKENIKLDPVKIDEIITATNNDIRQTINHISLLSAGKELNLSSDKASTKYGEKIAEKDLKMGPWEVVRKVFSVDEHKTMTFNDKCDLFFHDYSLASLFVQQNYLIVSPSGPKSEVISKVAKTADALSLGDLADKKIRSNSAWALLPTQAIFSSVMPGEYMSGHITGQINFPGWLGKNSRSSKRCRLAQEIHDHTRLRTSGSRLSVRLDYAPFLLDKIVKPLVDKGLEGVEESLATIKEYHLLREDIDSLIELTTWPGKKGPMDKVDGKVKAALTRAYNKEVLAYSYSATAGVKKKRAEASEGLEQLDGLEEQEEGTVATVSDDENDDDNLENDALIKAKKKTSTSATTKASTSKASGIKKTATSKPKTSIKSKK
ncbi:hypothetical protein DOY81_001550, partial [Sarcophaga bullata]